MEDKDTIENEKEAQADDLAKKCEEYLAGWKRAQADYANLKKETDREKTEFAKFANEKLILSFLTVFDQLERAIEFKPDAHEDNKMYMGVVAIHSTFEKVLRDQGVEFFEGSGELDPHQNEAVGQTDSAEPQGHVVKTIERGCRFNGKLLRPAKVIIAK